MKIARHSFTVVPVILEIHCLNCIVENNNNFKNIKETLFNFKLEKNSLLHNVLDYGSDNKVIVHRLLSLPFPK